MEVALLYAQLAKQLSISHPLIPVLLSTPHLPTVPMELCLARMSLLVPLALLVITWTPQILARTFWQQTSIA